MSVELLRDHSYFFFIQSCLNKNVLKFNNEKEKKFSFNKTLQASIKNFDFDQDDFINEYFDFNYVVKVQNEVENDMNKYF